MSVRVLLTQALELLAQEGTETSTEAVVLNLKQQVRRITEERDYYRAAYINTLNAKGNPT